MAAATKEGVEVKARARGLELSYSGRWKEIKDGIERFDRRMKENEEAARQQAEAKAAELPPPGIELGDQTEEPERPN